jgi:hypothetical protein
MSIDCSIGVAGLLSVVYHGLIARLNTGECVELVAFSWQSRITKYDSKSDKYRRCDE